MSLKLLRLSDVDVRGKRVFIRADLNVPQDDAENIADDTRIRASVPAIHDAWARGAAVMVTSHLGRPTEGQWKADDSLAPIARRLGELLDHDAQRAPRIARESRHADRRRWDREHLHPCGGREDRQVPCGARSRGGGKIDSR